MKGKGRLCAAVNKLSILCKPWGIRDQDTGWTIEEVLFDAREGKELLFFSKFFIPTLGSARFLVVGCGGCFRGRVWMDC